MSFQEFVSTGFGLFGPECAQVNHAKNRRKKYEYPSLSQQTQSEGDDSVGSEERESGQRRYHDNNEDRDIEQMSRDLIKRLKVVEAENKKLRAENQKWKSHVEKMMSDTRESLEEIKRQAGETVKLQKEIKELKSENENLKSENAYRDIIMRQMKKKQQQEESQKSVSVFDMINPCR